MLVDIGFSIDFLYQTVFIRDDNHLVIDLNAHLVSIQNADEISSRDMTDLSFSCLDSSSGQAFI